MSLEIKQCLEIPSLPSVLGSRVRLTVVSPPRIHECSWSEFSFDATVTNVGTFEDPRYVLSIKSSDKVLARLFDAIQLDNGWNDTSSLTISVKAQGDERYFVTGDVLTVQDTWSEYRNTTVGRLTAIKVL